MSSRSKQDHPNDPFNNSLISVACKAIGHSNQSFFRSNKKLIFLLVKTILPSLPTTPAYGVGDSRIKEVKRERSGVRNTH